MARKIKHIRTIDYYDGPQSFIASDQFGAKYFCVIIDITDKYNRFLCTPTSDDKLSLFYKREIDIKSIFTDAEADEFFSVDLSDDIDSWVELTHIDRKSMPDNWFPDEGLFYQFEGAEGGGIAQEAHERNRAIIHFTLSPPESRENGLNISAENLSRGLWLLQSLIKYSYKKSLLQQAPRARTALDREEYYRIDAFAVSAGNSFRLHLQNMIYPNLLGTSEIYQALKRLDEIIQVPENANLLLEIFRKNRGHLIKTYRKFIEFILEKDASITYEWAMPGEKQAVRRKITKFDAQPIYDLLLERQELDIEEKILIGVVLKLDVINENWTLRSDEDGKLYSGRAEKSGGVHLGGITAETKRYQFICLEKIEEETASGREITSLWLTSVKEL